MSWSKTMAKYPRLGSKKARPKNTSAKCPCGEVGKWLVDIQTSPFRGEDEVEWRCDTHKDWLSFTIDKAGKGDENL